MFVLQDRVQDLHELTLVIYIRLYFYWTTLLTLYSVAICLHGYIVTYQLLEN